MEAVGFAALRGRKRDAMFGYLTLSPEGISQEQQQRYRAFYCGLCRSLGQKYGSAGRLMLSNDMTFLCILLSSLYEPEETSGQGRCLPHPIKERGYVQNQFTDYAADMSIALAYHKCLDDWQDDRNPAARVEAKVLHKAYQGVRQRYPERCQTLEESLAQIARLERENCMAPDEPAKWTAKLLGAIFRYQEDTWAETLQAMGEALGHFVYLMDAYDDLPGDLAHRRYNPLAEYARQPGYEALCQEALTLLAAEAARAFETLPLVQDVHILRNIVYSGLWVRYRIRQQKRQKQQKKGGLSPKEDQG